MCALLAPIIKSGYNLFSPGPAHHKTKHVDRPRSSSGQAGKNSQIMLTGSNRQRTTSEYLPVTASVSTPAIMQPARRSKSTAGPPPVDIHRKRSAVGTSQYYLQQRRELARQQLAQKQFLQQQKQHNEKHSTGKMDKKRS